MNSTNHQSIITGSTNHQSLITNHRLYVDLHLHSTCSDGVFAPEEVVRKGAAAGLAAMALADHDNIDGVETAMA